MAVTVIGNKLKVEVLADESTKTQLTELNTKYDDLDSRVDTILTTPAESVSAQEIIDARQGEATLGANITKVKSQLVESEQQVNALQTTIDNTENKAFAPKLSFYQIASRGGKLNTTGLSSDYIVFADIYHVYDVGAKNTGLIYGLQEQISGATKQGIYKSLDGGNNWVKVGDLDIDQPAGIWYDMIYVEPFQETFYLIKVNNGYNKPENNDIVSFTNTLVQINSMNLGDARWLGNCHNIDSIPSADYSKRITMFAEYAQDAQSVVNVWKTTDKGATWNSVFTQTGNNGVVYSGEIRHFHTLAVDPHTKHWWLSSGDGDPQCKIWRSTDDGENWTLLFQGSQRERVCSFVFEEDYIYYGMDSAQSTTDHSKIVRINKTTLEREDIATVDMGHAVYCLTKTFYPEGFLVWSVYEHYANQHSDRILIEFYDYYSEKLYEVARVSRKKLPHNENVGFRNASRYQDMVNGSIFVEPTSNIQQLKYGSIRVSRLMRCKLTM